MNYNQSHRFYGGVDLHARTLFVHVLDHKGQTVFEHDLPADPKAFFTAIRPYRKDMGRGPTSEGCLVPLERARHRCQEPFRRCVQPAGRLRTG